MAKKSLKSINLIPEPNWVKLKQANTLEEKIEAFKYADFFVHYEVADKKLAEAVRTWIKNESGFSNDIIKTLCKVKDGWLVTYGKYCFIYYKIGFMPDNVKQHLKDHLPSLTERVTTNDDDADEKTEKKPEAPKVSIQERMFQQLEDLIGQWDLILDNFVTDKFELTKFDPAKDIKVYQSGIIKPAHAKMLRDFYENQYSEACEVLEWQDDDIKEAFSFMDAKDRKNYHAYFEKLINSLDAVILQGKSQRKSRKPKSRPKEKVVAKLKFKESDSALGIASVHPTEVVYCNELWIYNTKTRKIGVYHAINKDPKNMKREGAGLGIRGTTITDFDPDLSLQKTLRKPSEQIKNWVGNARTKFAKSFDEVKSVETKLNGRLNEHTVLLKVF